MFVSINQLFEAYKRLGFVQRPGEPFVFDREDGLMMFHPPFDGEVAVEFIIEDAATWDPVLAEQLLAAITAPEPDQVRSGARSRGLMFPVGRARIRATTGVGRTGAGGTPAVPVEGGPAGAGGDARIRTCGGRRGGGLFGYLHTYVPDSRFESNTTY